MIKTTIDVSGPFFAKDPVKRFHENVRDMLAAFATEGAQDIQAQFPTGGAGDPHPGLGRMGIVGRVHSLSGKPWQLTAVISQTHVYPWPGGGSKQYRGGKTEASRHMFRTTKSRLGRSRAVNVAELTKGMN